MEVFGIYAGFIDTGMVDYIARDKASPDEVARNTMVGIEAGDGNIDATEAARQTRIDLQKNPEGVKADAWLSAADFRANHPLA